MFYSDSQMVVKITSVTSWKVNVTSISVSLLQEGVTLCTIRLLFQY